MSEQRFGLSHVLCIALGVAVCVGMSRWGARDAFAPRVVALQKTVDSLAQEKARSDSATAYWRNTVDAERSEFVMALGDTTAKYRGVAQRASASSRARITALIAQLAARGDTSTAGALGEVAVTIHEADSACTLAVNSCEEARATLALQISDRDSMIFHRDTSLVRAMGAATRGASLAESADRARQAANRRTKVFMVLIALLGTLVILK